jgi:hypothetical protein
MRVLVCGGRDFGHAPTVWDALYKIDKETKIVLIIEGCATGADRIARSWAKTNVVDYISIEAEWDKYGRAAGPIRNKKMLDKGKPDLVVAFPGGKGTANMCKQARSAGVKVIEVALQS